MKKVILSVLCAFMILLLTGCGTKKVITTEEFKTIAESREMITTDIKTQYESYAYVKEATSATTPNYQVVFYVLDTVENATNMYTTNKTLFESYKGDISSYATVDMKNYSTYSLDTNGNYYYLARVENTIFYAVVQDKYKDEIKAIVKDLGY